MQTIAAAEFVFRNGMIASRHNPCIWNPLRVKLSRCRLRAPGPLALAPAHCCFSSAESNKGGLLKTLRLYAGSREEL